MRHTRDNIKGDPSTVGWWRELEAPRSQESWCCKVFKESGIEYVQCESHNHAFHRIKMLYCPHCGRKL